MFRNNPEEFISKIIRLINEQKAAMTVEHITYTESSEDPYDSTIFTAEKNPQCFEKAFAAEKAVQDYVFTDGTAEQSVERNTKNSLNYGNLSPQNRIYQSFCGDFFSIILMVFIISLRRSLTRLMKYVYMQSCQRDFRFRHR